MRDGRWICSQCWQARVPTDQALAELKEVATQLAREGITVDLTNVSLALVDYSGLPGGGRRAPLGHTQSEWRVRGSELTFARAQIRIVSNLTRSLFHDVAAHELCHVWIARHQRTPQPAPDCITEGAAQYAAFLVLSQMRGADSLADYLLRKMEMDDDYNYGQCFRKARDYVHSHGGLPALQRRLDRGSDL